MGAWDTAKKAIENSNNVNSKTYPNDTETYQDYTVKPGDKK
jgi:Na+/H+-translocating membrane pyrophosphatase